jgi:IS5 family transposase
MWVIRPIRPCWPRRSLRWRAAWRGSKPPVATRPRARDRRRSVGRRARSIASKLRLRGQQQRDEAQAAVRRITGELADIAAQCSREAAVVLRNARRALRAAAGPRKGRLQQAVNHLDTVVGRAAKVVAQTRSRVAGVMPESAGRVVNLHDVDARPIPKGRLGRPVEFGYKAQVVDNADGVILDHTIEIGNLLDAPQLAPAIERITRRTGRPPRAVTADRGYGYSSVEDDLHQLGVRSVAIPRVSKPGAARREFELRRAFRDKIKWRTGPEGRINHLKRSYGLNRTRPRSVNLASSLASRCQTMTKMERPSHGGRRRGLCRRGRPGVGDREHSFGHVAPTTALWRLVDERIDAARLPGIRTARSHKRVPARTRPITIRYNDIDHTPNS